MNLIENLQYFKQVAQTGSFSAAAKLSNISQPTMSKAIRSLEEYLGVTLLRRTTRGLSLTTEGQRLIATGAPLLDQVEFMLASVRSEKLKLQGQIRVTASLAFARVIMVPLFEDFATEHPGLKFNFILSDGYVDLVENNIDVAMRIGDLQDSSLKAIRIGTSRRALYAAKSYIKKYGQPKDLEALKKHRLLNYTRLSDRPMWPLVDKKGKSEPYYFEPYLQTDGTDLMREAVLKGLGIALLPTWMAINEEKRGAVIRILEGSKTVPTPIFAVASSSKELSARQRALIEFLRRKFDGIPELASRELQK